MRRRLLARYDCIQSGHNLCFVGESGKHVPLTGIDIEVWVNAWVRELHLWNTPDVLIACSSYAVHHFFTLHKALFRPTTSRIQLRRDPTAASLLLDRNLPSNIIDPYV